MTKSIAFVQIVLGFLGLLVWGWYFATSCRPAQEQFLQLDRIATDAALQAELATHVIDRGTALLVELEQSAALHQKVLLNAEQPLKLATDSLEQWERNLQSYSKLSLDASRIAERLAQQLPIQVPDVNVTMQDATLSIPEIEVQEQTLRIPVPKVKAGTRGVNLNLGLTELKVDVPTLTVTTDEQVMVVPKTAKVGSRTERFRIPSSVDVTYRELFAEEGRMLTEASLQLSQSSQNLLHSAATIDTAQDLLQHELPAGLAQTRSAIEQAQNALVQLRTEQLPTLRDTLQRQRGELELSRGSLQQLSHGVPWFFAILGLIPLAILLQGLNQFLGSSTT